MRRFREHLLLLLLGRFLEQLSGIAFFSYVGCFSYVECLSGVECLS